MKNARYRGIPVFYNPETTDIKGRNWFYDLLLDLNVWIDVNIVGVDGFPIFIEE